MALCANVLCALPVPRQSRLAHVNSQPQPQPPLQHIMTLTHASQRKQTRIHAKRMRYKRNARVRISPPLANTLHTTQTIRIRKQCMTRAHFSAHESTYYIFVRLRVCVIHMMRNTYTFERRTFRRQMRVSAQRLGDDDNNVTRCVCVYYTPSCCCCCAKL